MDVTQKNPNNGPNGRETMPNVNGSAVNPNTGRDDRDVSMPNGNGKIDNPFAPDNGSNRYWKTGEEILGRYQVVELLGQGGMGVVYRCKDLKGNVEVAVKALPPEVSHSTAEMEEVQENYSLVSKLVHTNIAVYKTLEMDSVTGDYYLVMEYVGGEDLRRWMKRVRKDGKVALETALPVLRQIAEALDYAHGQDVIHRDMKPDNVKILADGMVKVLDFGLAAQIRTSLAHVSKEEIARAGTNLYKSPEQWQARSRQGAAADQYSLAVTAYELLAGHVPFESDDMALLKAAVLKDDPEAIDGLPKYVNVVLKKGLAKESADRYASCVDFVRALGGEKVKPKVSAAGGRKKDKLPWLGVAAVVALLGLAGIFYALAGWRGGDPPVPEPPVAVKPAPPPEKPVAEVPLKDGPGGANPRQPEPSEPVDDEYYILANRLERFLKDDYDKNWDRKQTVGKHMDDFMTHYDGGYGAMKAGSHSKAYGSFKKAESERLWLVTNIPLRKQALEARQAAEGKKKKAESANADRYAHNYYENAKEQLNEAAKQLEQGEFKNAMDSFTQAGEAFEKTASSAKERHAAELSGGIEDSIRNERIVQAEKYLAELEPLSRERHAEMKGKIERAKSDLAVKEHLSKAKDAADNGRWQEAFDEAGTVLKISPDHDEAKALKQRAEGNLHPVVSFEAKADGRVVDAMFHVDGGTRTYRTRDARLDWEKGRTYRLDFSYEEGGEKWESRGSVIPDRNGRITYTVKLERKPRFDGTVRLPGGVELKLVKIPAGSFTMGSPEGELGRDSDETQHRVTISKDYWLGQYELTQGQWKAVGTTREKDNHFHGDRLPVENVSWDEAKAFCDDLNRRFKGQLPEGYRFDLPTEAQWEYACRAGTTTALNNGKNLTDEKYNCENLREVAWYDYHNDEDTTHPVGQKRKNNWGIYDMHGNVWEWCRDWYGSYPDGAVTDPQGPPNGSNRVFRGGAWLNDAGGCRSSDRGSNDPSFRIDYLGFRVALVPVP